MNSYGGICAIIGFVLLMFGVSDHIKVLCFLTAIVSGFGFITSFHSYKSDVHFINKLFRTIELLLCSFEILCGVVYTVL